MIKSTECGKSRQTDQDVKGACFQRWSSSPGKTLSYMVLMNCTSELERTIAGLENATRAINDAKASSMTPPSENFRIAVRGAWIHDAFVTARSSGRIFTYQAHSIHAVAYPPDQACHTQPPNDLYQHKTPDTTPSRFPRDETTCRTQHVVIRNPQRLFRRCSRHHSSSDFLIHVPRS